LPSAPTLSAPVQPAASPHSTPASLPSLNVTNQVPAQALQQAYPATAPTAHTSSAFPVTPGQASIGAQASAPNADNTYTPAILTGIGLTLTILLAAIALSLWRTKKHQDTIRLLLDRLSMPGENTQQQVTSKATSPAVEAAENPPFARHTYRAEPSIDPNGTHNSGFWKSPEFQNTVAPDISAVTEVMQRLHTIQDSQLQAEHILKKAHLNAQRNQILIQGLEQLTNQYAYSRNTGSVSDPNRHAQVSETNIFSEAVRRTPAPPAVSPVADTPNAAVPAPTHPRSAGIQSVTRGSNLPAEADKAFNVPPVSAESNATPDVPEESAKLAAAAPSQPKSINTIRHAGLGANVSAQLRAGQAPALHVQSARPQAVEPVRPQEVEIRQETSRRQDKPQLKIDSSKSQETLELALVYLNMGDRGTAEILLRELETTAPSEIAQNARNLLDQIKSH